VDAAMCCGKAPFHKAARSAYWITLTSARGFLPPRRDGNDCGLHRPCLANDTSTRIAPAIDIKKILR
jgi:hypothetical protein